MTSQAGPFRIPVRPALCGVRLDVSHFLAHLVRELADQARENGDSVLDELVAIADADSHARHDRSRGIEGDAEHRRDHLVDQLIERIGGSELPLTPQQTARLAAELTRITPPGTSTITPISGKAAA